jgi:hypothetical protein
MNPPRRIPRLLAGDLPGVAELLRELTLPDEAAELLLLIDLCRRSLRVRAWLFGRFAQEPVTQAAFRAFLVDPSSLLPNQTLWPRALAMALQPNTGGRMPREGPHGGLSEMQVLALIKGYQAGLLDVTPFILARLWRRFPRSDRMDPPLALQLASAKHWGAIANDDSGRMARDLLDALQFFRERSGRTVGEGDFGHANSWRIHVLVHILDHPRPSYKVGELHRSLPAKYRHVDRREVRDFCRRHDIRRDQRPGRPLRIFPESRKPCGLGRGALP